MFDDAAKGTVAQFRLIDDGLMLTVFWHQNVLAMPGVVSGPPDVPRASQAEVNGPC